MQRRDALRAMVASLAGAIAAPFVARSFSQPKMVAGELLPFDPMPIAPPYGERFVTITEDETSDPAVLAMRKALGDLRRQSIATQSIIDRMVF